MNREEAKIKLNSMYGFKARGTGKQFAINQFVEREDYFLESHEWETPHFLSVGTSRTTYTAGLKIDTIKVYKDYFTAELNGKELLVVKKRFRKLHTFSNSNQVVVIVWAK